MPSKLVSPVATPTAVRWVVSDAAAELVMVPVLELVPFQAPLLYAAATIWLIVPIEVLEMAMVYWVISTVAPAATVNGVLTGKAPVDPRISLPPSTLVPPL